MFSVPSAVSCGMTGPRSQSHCSLMMPMLGAVTEHWALNKARSSGYRVVQMAQTSKALGKLVWEEGPARSRVKERLEVRKPSTRLMGGWVWMHSNSEGSSTQWDNASLLTPRKARRAVKGGCIGLAVLGQNCSSDLKSRMYELGDLGRDEREPISIIHHLLIFFFLRRHRRNF